MNSISRNHCHPIWCFQWLQDYKICDTTCIMHDMAININQTFSVSGASTNLKSFNTATRAIFASISASLIAIHDLGPHPKGMCAIWCLFSFSSLVNLWSQNTGFTNICGKAIYENSFVKSNPKIVTNFIVMIINKNSTYDKPFWFKFRWIWPYFRWMMNSHYGNNNVTILRKHLTIDDNILWCMATCTIYTYIIQYAQ